MRLMSIGVVVAGLAAAGLVALPTVRTEAAA